MKKFEEEEFAFQCDITRAILAEAFQKRAIQAQKAIHDAQAIYAIVDGEEVLIYGSVAIREVTDTMHPLNILRVPVDGQEGLEKLQSFVGAIKPSEVC